MSSPENLQPDNTELLRSQVLSTYRELENTDHEEYVRIATLRWKTFSNEKREELILLASVFAEPEERQDYIRGVLVHDHASEQANQIIELEQRFNLPAVEHPPILG